MIVHGHPCANSQESTVLYNKPDAEQDPIVAPSVGQVYAAAAAETVLWAPDPISLPLQHH
jgi:hypothetical protein